MSLVLRLVLPAVWGVALPVLGQNSSAGESDVHELDDVTWTTAFLLIGFVVISVGILYLVNSKDPDMRKASWVLLSTTFSIFAATTLVFGIDRFLHRREINGDWLRLAFALLVFVLFHLLLLCVDPNVHGWEHRIYGRKVLGGHIEAFAAILFFGYFQKSSCEEVWIVFAVPLLAFVAMVLAYLAVLCLAEHFQPEILTQKETQVGQARLMQMEASAITVGFLIVQAGCFSTSTESKCEKRFMPITVQVPGEEPPFTVPVLLGVGVLLLVCSSIWSMPCVRSHLQECHLHECLHYLDEFWGELLSVTACWCFQRAGLIWLFQLVRHRMEWYLKKVCEHLECEPEAHHMEDQQATNRAQIVNALLMSIMAVLCVFLLDKLADWIEGKIGEVSLCESSSSDEHELHELPQLEPPQDEGLEQSDPLQLDIASGLRFVMSGLGMLVGISWDKAFETSFDTVLEEKSIDLMVEESDYISDFVAKNPQKTTSIIFAVRLLLCFFVVYAWYQHILPHAMRSEDAHQQDIRTQRRSFQRLTLPKTPSISPTSLALYERDQRALSGSTPDEVSSSA